MASGIHHFVKDEFSDIQLLPHGFIMTHGTQFLAVGEDGHDNHLQAGEFSGHGFHILPADIGFAYAIALGFEFCHFGSFVF